MQCELMSARKKINTFYNHIQRPYSEIPWSVHLNINMKEEF